MKKNPSAKKSTSLLRYASMAYELLAVLVIGVFLGRYLDRYFGNEKQVITALLTLLFLGGYLYKIVRDTSKSSRS